MMTAPGWYRVEGDPPETLRRWNGERWIGVPTLMQGAVPPVEPEPPARISPGGAATAFVSVAGFAFMALLMLSLALRIHRSVDAAGPDYFDAGSITNLHLLIDGFWWHVFLIAGLVIVTSISFTAWVSNAAIASRAISPSLVRSTGSADPTGSHAFQAVDAVLDRLLAPVEWVLSSYLFRGSKRTPVQPRHSAQRHRPGLFNLVNRVVESCDGEPLKVFAWWLLMWLPGVVALGSWSWLAVFGRQTAGSMQTVLRISEGVLALEILSTMLIIATIVSITRRLTPS